MKVDRAQFSAPDLLCRLIIGPSTFLKSVKLMFLSFTVLKNTNTISQTKKNVGRGVFRSNSPANKKASSKTGVKPAHLFKALYTRGRVL
jgi:hypothetical protein